MHWLECRLIKINQNAEYKQKQYNLDSFGRSKMKHLQAGGLKTGIYHNFYKSQIKSGSQLPSMYSN